MSVNKAVERCPLCKEEIAPGAMVCKHCHSIIKLPPKKKKVPAWRSTFMLGFYCGVAVMAALFYAYVKWL